ncbi:MAG TPA: hypothetical protein VLK85_23285 [Ramlibacter sp.]|nr:hypothetical protein [Ramlibacter sp.]
MQARHSRLDRLRRVRGELINTLEADSVQLPGHGSPDALPGAFAVSEAEHREKQ